MPNAQHAEDERSRFSLRNDLQTSISTSNRLHNLVIACLIGFCFAESVKYHKRARLSKKKRTPTLCPLLPSSVEVLASI